MDTTTPFQVLINAKAGTVLQLGQDEIRRLADDSGAPISELEFVEPKSFLDEVKKRLAGSNQPILIGGGDGTIMQCAPLFLEYGRPFGVLPMGTMNLLAQDAGIPNLLRDALAAYAGPVEELSIDVGMANDQMFLCCAALGMIPEATRFREKSRGQPNLLFLPRLTLFLFEHLHATHRRRLELELDGVKHRIKTSSLIISNNQFCAEGGAVCSFKKNSLQDGVLGIYSAKPKTWWDRLRLLLRLKTGAWKHDPVIKEFQGSELHVSTHRDHEIVTLDGENVRLKTPIRFWMQRQSLRVLKPAGSA